MRSTPRTLLRLHIETVWGIQLPPITQNTVELLREGIQPSWKLYAADVAGEQVVIWRPDVAASERETLLVRAREAFRLSVSFVRKDTTYHITTKVAPIELFLSLFSWMSCPFTYRLLD